MVEGQPPIDVTKIDPPPVQLDALDGSLRSQVEKMMVVFAKIFPLSMINRRKRRTSQQVMSKVKKVY